MPGEFYSAFISIPPLRNAHIKVTVPHCVNVTLAKLIDLIARREDNDITL